VLDVAILEDPLSPKKRFFRYLLYISFNRTHYCVSDCH